MSKKRILFIINPISGGGKNKTLIPLIERVIDKNKFAIEFALTEYKGHAKELAFNARLKKDIICVAGGDGSVNEVGTQLIESTCKLAILPTGSGNGIARHLGIPLKISAALERINQFNQTHIDIGKINAHHFIGVAGIGFDAYIAKRFDNYHKRGFWSYFKLVLSAFKNYKPITVKWGEKKEEHGQFLMCFILNSGQFGNGFKLSPDASMSDGMLTLLMIKKPSFIAGLPLVLRAYFGDLRTSCYSTAIEIERIKLNTTEPLIHIDGEPLDIEEGELQVSILKEALEVLT